jgi:hypothetical protein
MQCRAYGIVEALQRYSPLAQPLPISPHFIAAYTQ